jgi:hypothetical protein
LDGILMAYGTTNTDEPTATGFDTDEVLEEFKRRNSESEIHSQNWRTEARELYDLQAGHQWSPEDLARLEEKYQGAYPATTFNLVNKYVDAVTGLQINNRQEIRFYPREMGDVGVDEFATGTVRWNRDQCDAEDEETDTFGDVFLTGMGWVEHFLDDSEDPEAGFIAQERRDPIEMKWDPMARRRNLVDRRYQIRIKPMTMDEYEERFGEDAENLEGANSLASGDSSPQRIPIPHDYGSSSASGNSGPSKIHVADYQFCRNKIVYSVTATFPGQEPLKQIFSRKEWRDIKQALERSGTPFDVERMTTKAYYRAWICGDRVMGKVKELKCGFTYECITGKRDRNTNTWYGIGRVIKDPQCWVNKFFASILYTIAVNAKGGLMAEEDAFEDPVKAEQSWADPAAITYTASGAIAGGKIQPKPPAPYPQGMDRLMEFTLSLLPLTSGMNPELMGLADRQQPGVLEAQRKQAAMAILAWVFDAMRLYYKRSGKLMLSMVREYLPDGQLIRISGPQGTKYLPMLKDKLVGKYDIIIDEAPTSVNMRERVWVILQQIIPMALSAQLPIPPEVLDYAPLPAELAQKWKQRLQPTPQQQQEQEQSKQMQQRGAQAVIAKDESSAALNQAKAQATIAEAGLKQQSTPISDALVQAQTIKTAAEAGAAQAGG